MRWSLLAGLLLVVATLVACGGASGGGLRSATGVIIDVQAPSLTELDSFTLRTDDGQVFVFELASDASKDPQGGLVAGHLRSHALLVTRGEVFYRDEGGKHLAVRLEDR